MVLDLWSFITNIDFLDIIMVIVDNVIGFIFLFDIFFNGVHSTPFFVALL